MKLGSTSKKEILIYLTLVIVLIIVSILNNKIWKLGKNNKILPKDNKNITKPKAIETKSSPIKGRFFQKIEDNKKKFEDKKAFHGIQ